MSPTVKDEMKNDHELIKLFQKGDKSAYDRLVRKYVHTTVGFFYKITGDRMVAEDLAQDVFLKLFTFIFFIIFFAYILNQSIYFFCNLLL